MEVQPELGVVSKQTGYKSRIFMKLKAPTKISGQYKLFENIQLSYITLKIYYI